MCIFYNLLVAECCLYIHFNRFHDFDNILIGECVECEFICKKYITENAFHFFGENIYKTKAFYSVSTGREPWRKFNIAAIIYSTRTNTLTL